MIAPYRPCTGRAFRHRAIAVKGLLDFRIAHGYNGGWLHPQLIHQIPLEVEMASNENSEKI